MQPNLLSILVLGFLLGMRHALDADHLIAVSTLVSQQRSLRRAARVGALWGLGHTTTLFLVGVTVILFKVTIPERLAHSMEFAVGILLVILGATAIKGLIAGRVHAHVHGHGDSMHLHFHSHAGREDHQHEHPLPHRRRSLFAGMVHGLAGSAALMLLVLSTIRTEAAALLYVLLFGAGSVLGMLGISLILGLPFVLAAGRFSALQQRIRMAAGVASIAYGIAIMFHLGISQGLIRL